MTGLTKASQTLLPLAFLLAATLAACKPNEVEVTRIEILERRVIERVVVTVEVTRIQRLIETPKPTFDSLVPSSSNATPQPSASPSPVPDAPTPEKPISAATAMPPSSARQTGESLLAAIKDTEQTTLALIQALNSDPLPIGQIIELYDQLGGAPAFTIPDGEDILQSVHVRYRGQIDFVRAQATDLYAHMAKIQSGEADNTKINPIHLSLARDAASAGASTVQGLIREMESFLASQP